MKPLKRASSRVPLGTAVHQEIYERILSLRAEGYSVREIIEAGINVLEKSLGKGKHE